MSSDHVLSAVADGRLNNRTTHTFSPSKIEVVSDLGIRMFTYEEEHDKVSVANMYFRTPKAFERS